MCGICGGQSGSETVFPPSTLILHCHSFLSNAMYFHVIPRPLILHISATDSMRYNCYKSGYYRSVTKSTLLEEQNTFSTVSRFLLHRSF